MRSRMTAGQRKWHLQEKFLSAPTDELLPDEKGAAEVPQRKLRRGTKGQWNKRPTNQ